MIYNCFVSISCIWAVDFCLGAGAWGRPSCDSSSCGSGLVLLQFAWVVLSRCNVELAGGICFMFC